MTFDPEQDETEGHIRRRAHLDDAETTGASDAEGHARRRIEEAGDGDEAEGHSRRVR